jgi:hypothetical protein
MMRKLGSAQLINWKNMNPTTTIRSDSDGKLFRSKGIDQRTAL